MAKDISWDKYATRIKSQNGVQMYPRRSCARKASAKQKEYLYGLLDWIEEHYPEHPCLSYFEYDRKRIRRFDFLDVDARKAIYALVKITSDLGREQAFQKWYINIVKNKETGERKKIKGISANSCPIGYDLIGTYKVFYEQL